MSLPVGPTGEIKNIWRNHIGPMPTTPQTVQVFRPRRLKTKNQPA